MNTAVTPSSPSQRAVHGVIVASGIIGFVVGLVCYPTWHEGLERAQVLAGVVQHPSDAPMRLVMLSSWTIVQESAGLLLRYGVSERMATLVLSGLAGMVSLQALAVGVLALSGNAVLAVLASVAIVMAKAAEGGVTYPLSLIGSTNTDGVIGFSYVVLGLGLIGAGRARAGAFALGFAPAVYAPMGVSIWGVVAIALCVWPSMLRTARKPFALGALAAIACLLTHHWFRGSTGQIARIWIELGDPSSLMSVGLRYWDVHRQPFNLFSGSGMAIPISTGLALLWLVRFPDSLPVAAHTFLRMTVIAVALGGVLSLSYWFVPLQIPSAIALLIPSRLMDVGIFMLPVFVVGLLGRRQDDVAAQLVLAAILVSLLAIGFAIGATDTPLASRASKMELALAALALVLLAERSRRQGQAQGFAAGVAPRLLRASLLIVAVLLPLKVAAAAWGFQERLARQFQDGTTEPLFSAARNRPGMLLAQGGIESVQLRTRRPLLIDGATVDRAIYAPDALAGIARILERVYGVDFGARPTKNIGALTEDAGRMLWESRTRAEWQAIAGAFGVTDILTTREWRLQLPIISLNAEFILYAVPPN